jgi:hypothetical protein
MLDLRCSGADGWSRCGFRPHLETRPDALPDDEGDAAKEGTAAAWVAECCINGDAYYAEDMVGRVHPNGVEISPDMARHLQPYIDLARSRQGAKAENFGEVRSPDGSFRIIGTSDLWSWSSGPDDFHVDDLKFGFGVKEPTTRQLTAYALIAHYAYGITPARWHLGIFQPRAQHPLGPYRVRTLTHDEFLQEASALWQDAARAANPVNATPGNHCLHCRAAAICTALTHSVYKFADMIETRSYLEPTDQQLADELEYLDSLETLISARRSAVEAETVFRIDNGRMIPGWAKVPTVGKRAWKYPPEIIQAMIGADINVTQQSLVTPAEAERRHAPKEIIEQLTKRPVVGFKLGRYNADIVANLFKKG